MTVVVTFRMYHKALNRTFYRAVADLKTPKCRVDASD